MSRAGLFPTVKSTGALMPSDILVRIQAGASSGLPGLRGEDYGLASGETVENAAARAWTYLLTTWSGFREALAALPGGDRAVQVTRQRWLLVLMRELGFGTVGASHGVELGDGTRVPLSHEWNCVPLHLLGWNVPLDTRTPGLAGAASASPQSMVQELLNRSNERLWAVLSNGRLLRILRDSTALAGAAYVEFDLEAMFDGEAFPDFRLLFALCHASRFTPLDDAGAALTTCWLERWRAEAIQTGTRALAQLGAGVEGALQLLGSGFVSHPDNVDLREELASGYRSAGSFQHGLLRLVYRILFLFVVEDRGALHPDHSDPIASQRYRDHYSGARLRHLARVRHGSSHSDLWEGLASVLGALGGEGENGLALPALAGLFDPAEEDLPTGLSLANDALLDAVRALSWVRDRGGPWRPVDYRNLGAEELGSIYESLLELVADVDLGAREVRLRRVVGNERKTTGSYYTPTDLIALVLREALDPLLDEAVKEAADAADAEARLLALTVCDPACGSGHFLVAAARRIARRIAEVRTGEVEPPPDTVREALHDVVEKCIYGVDMNPLSAELAKVSLWLEAVAPGRPLSFLDAQVKSGNSLLGTTPALLARGLPDAAFAVLRGDDKRVASELKRTNAEFVKKGLRFGGHSSARYEQVELVEGLGQKSTQQSLSMETDGLDVLRSLRGRRQRTAAETRRLADAYREAELALDVVAAKAAADTWCAAFAQPKPADWYGRVDGLTSGITSRTVATVANHGPGAVGQELREIVERVSAVYRFFHWHLEFPQIFAMSADPDQSMSVHGWTGGFSCVIGNPPWENYRPLDSEFFAAAGRDDIVGARTAAIREELIEALQESDPPLYAAYWQAQREFSGTVRFLGQAGRFPLTGTGNLTTHDLFAEHCRDITAPHGSSGVLIPTSVMTGSQTAPFVADLIERQEISSFYDFINTSHLFPSVHSLYRFGALGITGPRRRNTHVPLAFHLTDPNQIGPETLIVLSAADLARLNPNTKNLPVFASPRDATITASIHRAHPVLRALGVDDGNPWQVAVSDMFHMSHEAQLFASASDLESRGAVFDGTAWRRGQQRWLPLYEGKHVWLYDHRFATGKGAPLDKVRDMTLAEHDDPSVEIVTRHYVAEQDVDRKLTHRTGRSWLMGWRDIASATNQRTLIPAVIPRVAAGNKFPMIYVNQDADSVCLLAALSSLPCDYVLRQKSSGASVLKFMLNQLPVPHPKTFADRCPWSAEHSLAQWMTPLVVELTYTSWSLRPWASDLGVGGSPFRWDPERRVIIQAELDAAMFHVYGLDEGQTSHVLNSFRALRDAENRQLGEFRTERLVLTAYAQIAAAVRDGATFTSAAYPAPGHGPRHHARTRPDAEAHSAPKIHESDAATAWGDR